jgi:hypothetical protein
MVSKPNCLILTIRANSGSYDFLWPFLQEFLAFLAVTTISIGISLRQFLKASELPVLHEVDAIAGARIATAKTFFRTHIKVESSSIFAELIRPRCLLLESLPFSPHSVEIVCHVQLFVEQLALTGGHDHGIFGKRHAASKPKRPFMVESFVQQHQS